MLKNEQNNMNNNLSYREIINNNDFFIATPVGTSMLPLIRERIDTVRLVKITRKLHKYDVILYERPDGTFVLHRIIKVIRKNSQEKYVLCGDNQFYLEKYVNISSIIAVMEGYYKGESYIPITDKGYIRYSKRRVRTRLLRKLRYKLSQIYHKIFKKKK